MLLLLIGTSSTGKTTLARALQKELPGYWQYTGLDVFFGGMPVQYGGGLNGPLSAEGFSYQNKETDASIAYGNTGKRVLQGMIASAITFEASGTNLIFDEMLLDAGHAELWRDALKKLDSIVIRLSASLETLVSRNAKRNNPPGLALNHIEANNLLSADLSFNSDDQTPEECAKLVNEYLQALSP